MKYIYGIDLGGTKIEGIVLAVDEYKDGYKNSNITYDVICRKRISTEQELGYEHIIQNIKKLINILEKETNQTINLIGIGTPGVIDTKTQLLKNSNAQCLNGKPLLKDLTNLLKCKVIISNDANCFVLAEHKLGAARNSSLTFGVIMGTGVGGGIIINDEIYEGHQGIAGEWGHIIALDDGDDCYCGLKGCVETLISGPALEKFYELTAKKKAHLEEIISLGNSDPNASLTLDRLHFFFGKSLAKVVNILDPEVIVLGGGLSNIESLYTSGLQVLKKHVFNTSFDTRLVKNELGDSAGVFGAALLTLSNK